MARIQLAIEGKDAVKATESLVAELSELPEISGEWKKAENEGRHDRAIDIGTFADIISMSGCSIVAVAQIIYNWYLKNKTAKTDKPDKPPEKGELTKRLEKVLLICGERRLVMRDASLEDVERFLEKC